MEGSREPLEISEQGTHILESSSPEALSYSSRGKMGMNQGESRRQGNWDRSCAEEVKTVQPKPNVGGMEV